MRFAFFKLLTQPPGVIFRAPKKVRKANLILAEIENR